MREVTQKWSDENLNQKFDLITSSPPYFPLETGVLGDHPQKIECRFETRGGIEAYAQAASPWLAPGGMFFTIMPTLQEKRTLTALAEVGMFVVRSRAIITQEGESSLLSVYAAAKESDYPVGFKPESLGTHYRDEPLVIRLKDGRVSPEYLRVKGMMGFPPTH
jgi:tRNA1(Val) A37 N6-methylase TrmN6